MNLKFIDDYINSKLAENEEFIKFTYYELKIKNNLTDEDIAIFLNLAKTRLSNIGYKVYNEGEKYTYKEETYTVQTTELMIAIKE
jgi:hypothetical protein